jgi:UDP-galactopyranose mutase
MWNKELEELDPTILQRVPIRDDDNECYFPNDEYQCMPKHGYTELFKKMLDHENIEVNLNFEFKAADLRDFYHVFNSMPIDQYYNFCYGELPYRSIKFHHAVVNMPRVLPTTTVNFTHSGPYTRVTEWKHIPNHGENPYQTILTSIKFGQIQNFKNELESLVLLGKVEANKNIYSKEDLEKLDEAGIKMNTNRNVDLEVSSLKSNTKYKVLYSEDAKTWNYMS